MCQSLFFKKGGSGTGVFCEFCQISQDTVFHRTPLAAASEENNLAVLDK